MRSLTKCFVLVGLFVVAASSLAHAQGDKPADERLPSAPPGATREEVEQLRREVAELKATIQRLIQTNQQAAGGARLVEVSAVQPGSVASSAEVAQAEKQGAPKKGSEAALQSGWNGEHFFLKNSDGSFKIEPYGYLQLDHRAYEGLSTPVNTFVVRRARFGFQGTLGKHYEFALLIDSADTTTPSTIVLRDFYLNVKARPEFQLQFGQFKEPFAQEEMTGAAYLDFVERSLASLLYPSPTSFRSPGATVHGDLIGGVVQYWAGAFNGKGNLTDNTTSTPEGVGRLRFYPWRKSTNGWLQGFAFGGAITYGHTTKETSFSGRLPDRTFTFFSTTTINGLVERYNGEFTWTKGPLALRTEYDQLNQFRRGLGTLSSNLPGVVGKGYYATASYLLTGEKRPENGQPKPHHPFLFTEGERGIGAWELKFRYANLQAKALGTSSVPTQENRVDEFSSGINWYPNYFVRYMIDFNVERLKNPTSTLQPQTFLSVLQRVQFRF